MDPMGSRVWGAWAVLHPGHKRCFPIVMSYKHYLDFNAGGIIP